MLVFGIIRDNTDYCNFLLLHFILISRYVYVLAVNCLYRRRNSCVSKVLSVDLIFAE